MAAFPHSSTRSPTRAAELPWDAMLDLRALRADPATARAALARRGADADLDRLLELDDRWRALQGAVDELRARRNAAAQAIGEAKKAGRDAAAEIASAAALRDELTRSEEDLREAESARQAKSPSGPAMARAQEIPATAMHSAAIRAMRLIFWGSSESQQLRPARGRVQYRRCDPKQAHRHTGVRSLR